MKREWLIVFRKAKGLTQSEVAEALKISQITYSSYETGKRNPKPSMAKKIAKIFGFHWTKFYEE